MVPPVPVATQANLDRHVFDSENEMADETNNNTAVVPDLQTKERTALRLLASRETKAKSYLRGSVLVLLVMATIVISYFNYTSKSRDQYKAFENSFQRYASTLIESFHRSVKKHLASMDALAIVITSHARSANETFPFVTFPNFEVIAANTRILTGSTYMAYTPLVQPEQLEDWNHYSWQNRQQFLDAMEEEAIQQKIQDETFHSVGNTLGLDYNVPVLNLSDRIYYVEGAEINVSDPFLPLWHASPAIPLSTMNSDVLSFPWVKVMNLEAIRSGKAVLGQSRFRNQLDQITEAYVRLLVAFGQYRDESDNFLNGPITPLSYPVFDSLDPRTRRVSGLLHTFFDWKENFRNILPETAKGIMCVVTNSFNQTFTYKINGVDASYVENSDPAPIRYNQVAQSADINQYLIQIAVKQTTTYTSVELSSYSNYQITVYPTEETKRQFTNSEPIRGVFVVVGIFLFVSAVFLSYDGCVRRHQRILTDRAVISGAIVSSLFPSQVRDKLYKKDVRELEDRNRKLFGMRDYFKRHQEDRESDVAVGDDVIAECFENTTIMFADIQGFTEWSKERTADQVFCLLETLFLAFDELAIRLKVFKVETIGDCYVAVTGLPGPQEKHAVILSKFALHCLAKMRELVAALSTNLGPETSSLALRIGLHSGPVTGGVLRGQKSRFQLFGPTMNQASRMESTGIAGRIQVSQETANELIRHGKQHWLTERLDEIEAKGLGLLKTYWVFSDSTSFQSHCDVDCV